MALVTVLHSTYILYVLMQGVFEDTKGVTRISKSMKGRQHNGQKKKDKQRSTHSRHVLLVLKLKQIYTQSVDQIIVKG